MKFFLAKSLQRSQPRVIKLAPSLEQECSSFSSFRVYLQLPRKGTTTKILGKSLYISQSIPIYLGIISGTRAEDLNQISMLNCAFQEW